MSFKILLLCVFSIQFAMIKCDTMCVVMGLPGCYSSFAQRTDDDYCSGADATIKCLKDKATECGLGDSTEVVIMEEKLQEACKEGTELNKAYEEHKTCVFRRAPTSAATCYEDMTAAMLKVKSTGNFKKDFKERFMVSCKYVDDVNTCVYNTMKEICGLDAATFQRNFSSGSDELTKLACNGATAVFQLTWRVLLLASSAMFAIKLFDLNL